jgi:hypothetical protein
MMSKQLSLSEKDVWTLILLRNLIAKSRPSLIASVLIGVCSGGVHFRDIGASAANREHLPRFAAHMWIGTPCACDEIVFLNSI